LYVSSHYRYRFFLQTDNSQNAIRVSVIKISGKEFEIIDDYPQQKQKTCSIKMKDFVRNYLKICKLVLRSIVPDLRSFKWWQALILLLFAIFMVAFSVLVNRSIDFYKRAKVLFYLGFQFIFSSRYETCITQLDK